MITIARDGQRPTTRQVQKYTGNGHLPIDVYAPDDTQHINGLFYGDTGAGKTFLLGTAIRVPEMMPALLMDIDGGTLTLKGIPSELISIVRPRSWKQIQELYKFLYFDNRKYKSLFVDTLTETQRRHSMGTILGEVDQAQGGYYRDLEGTPVANRQDWLKSSGQVTKFIQAFRGLAYLPDPERRMHVIFTAHEKLNERSRTVSPELPGALGLQCGRWVDVLGRLSWHMVEDEDTGELVEIRHLLTAPYTDADGTRYLAKNRGGRLGRSLWEPTMTKISAAWRGEPPDDTQPVAERVGDGNDDA